MVASSPPYIYKVPRHKLIGQVVANSKKHRKTPEASEKLL